MHFKMRLITAATSCLLCIGVAHAAASDAVAPTAPASRPTAAALEYTVRVLGGKVTLTGVAPSQSAIAGLLREVSTNGSLDAATLDEVKASADGALAFRISGTQPAAPRSASSSDYKVVSDDANGKVTVTGTASDKAAVAQVMSNIQTQGFATAPSLDYVRATDGGRVAFQISARARPHHPARSIANSRSDSVAPGNVISRSKVQPSF